MSDAHKNKTHLEESIQKMSEKKKGKKCWNDGCGNIKYMIECPGDGWRPGRK
jgi:NUMOD3 motif